MTDGGVGNEEELFGYIRKHLGRSRLFTVGIGSAPNSHFMTKAAEFGRGTFTYVGSVSEVQEKMGGLFRKLENPVLTDLRIDWDDATVEAWPAKIPDLYAGEPLVVTMRTPAGAAKPLGRLVADGFSASISASAEETQSGIARLWARQKIDALRDSLFTGADATAVRDEIITLALAHHLVTEHTSLVAVDTTPAGVDAKSCTSELVPINLPEGWGGIEGSLPQTATDAPLSMLIGVALLLAALAARRIAS